MSFRRSCEYLGYLGSFWGVEKLKSTERKWSVGFGGYRSQMTPLWPHNHCTIVYRSILLRHSARLILYCVHALRLPGVFCHFWAIIMKVGGGEKASKFMEFLASL